MGIWHWINLWCNRFGAHHAFHGRDVCDFCSTITAHYLTRCSNSLYDRKLTTKPPRTSTGLRYRLDTLIGVTGVRLTKYRASWYEVVSAPFKLVWRPHLLAILVFEV